ncbi:MAG: ABC transporter permease [Hyphomicrobiales bacterium]
MAKISLLKNLILREIHSRYRGSLLGIFWMLLTPFIMLSVYTFIFGVLFRSRWPSTNEDASIYEFAAILFVGLILFHLFSGVINRAPGLILANKNYVTKIVFPLEILVPVALGSALFQAGVSFIVLLVFMIFIYGYIPLTVFLLPLPLIPFCLIILGLSWFLTSLGTYLRDIGQILGTIVTAMMFLSPIFFPLSRLPDWIQPWVLLNPIALPVEQVRNVVVFGKGLDWQALGIYFVVSLIIAYSGYWFFQKTKKGFADVL